MQDIRTASGYFNQETLSDVTFILKEGKFSETGDNKLHAHWFQLCLGAEYFCAMRRTHQGETDIMVEQDISRVVSFIYMDEYVWNSNPLEIIVDMHLAKQMELEIPFDHCWSTSVSLLTSAMAIDDVFVEDLFKKSMLLNLSDKNNFQLLDAVVDHFVDDDTSYIPTVAMAVLADTILNIAGRLPQNFVVLYNNWRQSRKEGPINIVSYAPISTELHVIDRTGEQEMEDIGELHGRELPNNIPINKFIHGDRQPYTVPDKTREDIRGSDFDPEWDIVHLDTTLLFQTCPELEKRLKRYSKMRDFGLSSLEELRQREAQLMSITERLEGREIPRRPAKRPSPARVPRQRSLIRFLPPRIESPRRRSVPRVRRASPSPRRQVAEYDTEEVEASDDTTDYE